MKKELASLAIAFFALAFCGAAEELCPKAFGVGAPALLAAAAYMSLRRPPVEGLLFAAAAGFAEDALSSLPFAMSACFFVAVAAVLRGFKLPLAFAAPAYPAYQIWLWMWFGSELNGSVFMRMAMSVPAGAATLFAVAWALLYVDGKAAMDEA